MLDRTAFGWMGCLFLLGGFFWACEPDGPTKTPGPPVPGDSMGPGDDGLGSDGGGDGMVDGGPGDENAAGDAGGDGGGGGDSGPVVTQCGNSWPLPGEGTCSVDAGNDNLLLRGDLILPDIIVEAGEVLVEDGVITCVGCDCGSLASATGATILTCPEGVISPGLINPHDHISFTQAKPVAHPGIRYEHRHQWRKGLDGFAALTVSSNDHSLGDAWGEMRQVMAGTTSLFGSGGEDGFLRNLDQSSRLEGLTHDDASYRTFPLGDSGGFMATSGCAGYDIDDAATAQDNAAYVPHLAEGINDAAHNEFVCVSGLAPDSEDLLFATSAFIHGVGVTATDVSLMAVEGTGLVWSPRTNSDLYGNTAKVPMYDRLGVLIALGSDWTATGSINLLRELACADLWNTTYWSGYFSDADLVAMVTRWSAELLGFGDLLGSLQPGKVADIVIWNGAIQHGYRAILEADVDDVVLVFRGGTPLYGDAPLVGALTQGGECEALEVCGQSKAICAQREIGTTVTQLGAELGDSTYDLFFCGPPPDEPVCVPFRPGEYDGLPSAGDLDADGVADVADNCPGIFNPVRPMDDGIQPDTDQDDVGDACDVCPLNANTTSCSTIDPEDPDGDGVGMATDNCPLDPNPNQEDDDQDGKGNVCDPCPDAYNPADAGCPTSIYDIKNGTVALGQAVVVEDSLVSAVSGDGFFLTMDPAGSDYVAPDYSAIFVYQSSGTLPVTGTRLRVTGVVNEYFGEIELTKATIDVLDPVSIPIVPLVIDPAEVVPGGSKEWAYEALLVTVENVTVLDTNPPGESNETVTNEFLVTGGLTVDDGIYLVDPWVQEGQLIPSITGVLRYTWNRNKLWPRSTLDAVLGNPGLVSFGPSEVYVFDNETGPSAPSLWVGVNPPAAVDTVVPITSDNPTAVSVVGDGVMVPAGSSSVEVSLIAGSSPAGPVPLTASLDGTDLVAQVVVLDQTIPAVPVSLEPGSAVVAQSHVTPYTVTLDRPAPPSDQLVTLGHTGVDLTLPTDVTVPYRSFSGAFDVTAGTTAGSAEISATVGVTSVTAQLEVTNAPPVGLLMVEVFYDASGEDTTLEWIKLYNGTGETLDLADYSLGWGGTDYTYGQHQLAGAIPAGECFVVGGPVSDSVNFNPALDPVAQPPVGQPSDLDPDLQNGGSDADGIALFNKPRSQVDAATVPIDVVVYGTPGSNNNGLLGPDGQPSIVHVPDASRDESLVRTGVDSWTTSGDLLTTPNSTACIVIE